MAQNTPLFTFGIFADVQYADVDDLIKYGRKRYYRSSIENLSQALQKWKTDSDFKIVLQLGDLIDARQSKSVDESLDTVLNIFKTENYDTNKVLHIWGNHELTAFNRNELNKTILNTSNLLHQNSEANYYYYDLSDRLRIICLDEYEFSIFGFEKNDSIFKQATAFLHDKSLLIKNSNDPNITKYMNRFLMYNGAISNLQLIWLKDQLEFCDKTNKKVILAGHIPLMSETSDGCAVWNSEEIMDLLWSFDNLVLVYLAGHYHDGGYYLDKKNIHHLTLNGMLETPPKSDNSFVTVYVYENQIEFKNQIKERSFRVSY